MALKKSPPTLQVDIIISHHTLEHVEDPAAILKALKKHLKPRGRLIMVLPIDDWRKQKHYTTTDINQHLYTWTPLLIGNLVTTCGYSLKEARIITSAWLPLSRYYYQYIPTFIYAFFANIWSRMILSRQLKVIATVGK